MIATISADIVDSTALSSEGQEVLREAIHHFFAQMGNVCPGFWGRMTRGDFIECVIPTPESSLRIALLLKLTIKALDLKAEVSSDSQLPIYGARIAIGLGSMRTIDRANDIMDGEAIYLSGRQIDKKEPCTKGTLKLCASNNKFYTQASACVLVDALANRMTAKQSQVIYYKLLNAKVDDIAHEMGISQSTVSQHSTQAYWYAVQSAVETFELFISEKQ
jgi:hypothetical protein